MKTIAPGLFGVPGRGAGARASTSPSAPPGRPPGRWPGRPPTRAAPPTPVRRVGRSTHPTSARRSTPGPSLRTAPEHGPHERPGDDDERPLHPHPRGPVLLRPVDRRLAGRRRVRRRDPAAAGPRARPCTGSRPRRLRHHLPRQRRVPVRRDPARSRSSLAPFRTALDETGLVGPDGHDEPVLAPGLPRRRLHQQRPRRTPLRDPQGVRTTSTSPPSWARKVSSRGAAARAPSPARQGRPRGPRPLQGGLRPPRRSTSSSRATTCVSRSSPSPTSRAATSCCRRSGTRWRSSTSSSTPSWSG